MWKADQWKDYEVLDTSDGEKLERWGSFYLVRPDPQVIWSTPRQDPRWKRFDARYARSSIPHRGWRRGGLQCARSCADAGRPGENSRLGLRVRRTAAL